MEKSKGGKGGYILGAIGLVLGLIIGFMFDAMMMAITGNPGSAAWGNALRSALIKSFIGGVLGLIAGDLIERYLKSDD